MLQLELFLKLQGIIFSVMLIIDRLLSEDLRKEKITPVFLAVLVMNVGQLGSDFLAVTFDGSQTQLGWVLNHVSNFTLYIFLIFLIMMMSIFAEAYVSDTGSFKFSECPWIKVSIFLSVVNLIGLFLTPFLHLYYIIDDFNNYSRQPFHTGYMILQFATVLVVWITLIARIRSLDLGKLRVLAMYFLFPAIGGLLQWKFSGHDFFNLGTGISVLIIMAVYGKRAYIRQMKQAELLRESRAYLLNSQIKPHFMFNSLAVIQSLIDEDPEAAKEAIGYFSRYLRKGLDPKKGERPVSIREELDYVKCYLYMQQLRFGDKLKVEVEEQAHQDFDIPFLSIQPLAENAINHGIRPKLDGGTLLIRVYTTEKNNVVDVIDDGVGFDPDILKQRHSPVEHIGLSNVEERIRLLCDGQLVIETEPGKGTKMSIRIPVEDRKS